MYIVIVDARETPESSQFGKTNAIIAITNPAGDLRQFKTLEEAYSFMENHPLAIFPLRYINMDDCSK